jgi:hypothetical protein
MLEEGARVIERALTALLPDVALRTSARARRCVMR